MTLNWDFTYFLKQNLFTQTLLSWKWCMHTFLSQKWFTHTFFVAKMIYGHFILSRKQLTHTIHAFFVAKTIYALHLESFCAFIFAIRKVHTFWDSAPQNPDKLADLSRPTWSCFSSTWLVLSQKLDLAIGLLAYWSKVCLMSSILKT